MRSIHIATLTIVTLLWAPMAFAHEGHAHKSVMGSVTKLDRARMVVKTREGKTVSIALTDDTEYRGQGGEDSRRDVQVGDRVVVRAMGEGADLSADEVRFSHAGRRERAEESDVEGPRRRSRPGDYDDNPASDADDYDYR